MRAQTQRSVIPHAIAPSRVLRGFGAWAEALPTVRQFGNRPLLLGRSGATHRARQRLERDLQVSGLQPQSAELCFDCCEEDLQRLQVHARTCEADSVLAAGGGKVLDAGKLLAQRLGLPCTTVPLSPATCAGWTALSNLYSPNGAFLGDLCLERCPELLVCDHQLLLTAPPRTLASGIADAMAKWYEASVSSGHSTDGLVQQALQQARVLRDQLLLDAAEAMQEPRSDAWARAVEASTLTAGLIGGLGGARCRTVAAHALHNALTHLPATRRWLHGEKVAVGVLVQLRLEERLGGNGLAGQAHRQLLPFFQSLQLPTSLDDLGLSRIGLQDWRHVCRLACAPGSDLHLLPFPVTEDDLLQTLLSDLSAPSPSRS